ncbi:MAG: hypothetical protein QOD11_2666 [Bradyrhizobium sp.]|jgi:hypothetical protein|nr:hypothetical protein [Bradyrhizobium sp.]
MIELQPRSPHERSDMRDNKREVATASLLMDFPGCRFAHPGYGHGAHHD